jgi:hypothetical protein
VSGLAHYLEDEGLAPVIVALVREHIVSMRPPRALWVPFELGRPFGAPGNTDLQRRVLQASLALLDKKVTTPVLEDFNEATLADGGTANDDNWRFPGTLDNSSVLAEAASIMPLWQIARERLGKTTLGISGLAPVAAVELVERFHSADPMPNLKGMAPVSRARFSIDDIKVFYFEAALAEGGHPSTQQLHEWFWNGTLAGALLLDFQELARISDDKNLRLIASSLVPAERTHWFLNGLKSPT